MMNIEYVCYLIQSTFYRLIKGQLKYLKKMYEINYDD